MYERILVPLDGSKLAEAVLPSVAPLARGLGARVVLLGVDGAGGPEVRGGEPDGPGPASIRTMERGAVPLNTYLKGVKDHLAANEVEAEWSVVAGKVSKEILDQAKEQGSDLIAMSTRGRSGLGRGIWGSVTDSVVRSSEVPVMVVGPKGASTYQSREMEIKSVVVPLDGSPLAEAVLPHVVELASRLFLEVALVRVVRLPTMAYAGFEPLPMELADIERQMQEEAEQYLGRIARRLEGKGIGTRATVLKGPVGAQIVDYAQSTEGTMVAISTHGRSGLRRMALGSVADMVIRSLEIPVLVVRPAP